VRARPVPEGIAYRFTLNTMTEPDVAAVAVDIDTDRNASTGTDQWGYGIDTLGDLGLTHVLITWGTGAELDGPPSLNDNVTLDLDRNQIEVTVPLEPREAAWRHYAVTGLWSTKTHQFKQLQREPSEDQPGGATPTENPPPVFNVAFRSNDQVPAAGAFSGVEG